MKKKLLFLIIFILIIGAIYYILIYRTKQTGSDQFTTNKRTELLLFCGAGIRPAADLLIKEFETKHNIKINTTYGGSGRLLGQISSIKKGDLFMPGAEFYVDLAIKDELAYKDTKNIVAGIAVSNSMSAQVHR